MVIKVILFDQFNVLVPAPFPVPIWPDLEQQHGLPAECIQDTMQPLMPLWHQLECGHVTITHLENTFNERLREKLGDANLPYISPLLSYCHTFECGPGQQHTYPAMRHLLPALHQQGYRLGLITNNIGTDDHINQSACYIGSLEQYFELVLESCRVGVKKPYKEIYEMALNRLQVSASECVFLDDNPTYLDVPKQMGMCTILSIMQVQDTDTAITQLNQLLADNK